MNRNDERLRHRRTRIAAAALGVAAVLALAAGPAEARDRGRHGARHGHDVVRVHGDHHGDRGRGHRRVDRTRGHRHSRHDERVIVRGDYGRFERGPVVRHRRHEHVRRSRGFVVPGRIYEPVRYVEYRHGRVFHAGHGHWHDVYRFPVYTEFGLAWTPYDYCDGHVHARGSFGYDGPRFSVRIGF